MPVALVGENGLYCVRLWGKVGECGTSVCADVSLFKDKLEHMFLGQFNHTIDSKGRLTIPVRFRAALASGAYLTQGFDRNLMVYTTERFHKLAQRATTLTTTDPEARAIRRVIFGGATEVSLDSAGRILIPPFLRQYAEIESETAIIGAGEYFEIWREDLWEKELEAVMDPKANARRFVSLDISSG